MRIKAGNISRALRRAGHTLVYPDRRRQGLSVRQYDDARVSVTLSYDDTPADLMEILGDVADTLDAAGYVVQVDWATPHSAQLLVRRPSQVS